MVAGAIRRRRVPPQTNPYGLLNAMQPYGMKRQGTTGLMGAQQRIQRGPGRPVPRGITKTREGPAQEGYQQPPSPLDAYQQGKAANKTLTGIFDGTLEKNISAYGDKVSERFMSTGKDVRTATTGLKNWLTDTTSMTDAQMVGGTSIPASNVGTGLTTSPWPGSLGTTAGAGGTFMTPHGVSPAEGMMWADGSMVGGGAPASMNTAQSAQALQGLDTATTKGAEAAAGTSGQPWLAYAKIGYDVLSGEGGDKLTGSVAADTVMRGVAAYYTFGLSELAYGFM